MVCFLFPTLLCGNAYGRLMDVVRYGFPRVIAADHVMSGLVLTFLANPQQLKVALGEGEQRFGESSPKTTGKMMGKTTGKTPDRILAGCGSCLLLDICLPGMEAVDHAIRVNTLFDATNWYDGYGSLQL